MALIRQVLIVTVCAFAVECTLPLMGGGGGGLGAMGSMGLGGLGLHANLGANIGAMGGPMGMGGMGMGGMGMGGMGMGGMGMGGPMGMGPMGMMGFKDKNGQDKPDAAGALNPEKVIEDAAHHVAEGAQLLEPRGHGPEGPRSPIPHGPQGARGPGPHGPGPHGHERPH